MGRDGAQLGLFGSPAVGSSGSADKADPDGLRYYQRDAYQACLAALEKHRSALVVMATGLGKTQLFAALAKHWTGRVLVLAHRQELVFQARDRIEQMAGEPVGVEKANLHSGRERIVVASVQTATKQRRLDKLSAFGGFDLIVTDEAHHYTAKSYRRVLEHFGDAKLIGVTATPWRSDKRALGRIFETVAYERNILEGIEDGFLVPLTGRSVAIEEIDISQTRVSGGDFVSGELDETVLKGVEGIVHKTLELYPDRRGPIFFPGKASAEMAASRFNAIAPGSAIAVTDDTKPEDRARAMAACKEGRVRYLCNVMIATEGFDWPEANLVGLARPTKSVTVHTQMIGRGTRTVADVNTVSGREESAERVRRIAASQKPDTVILDFVGNCGKHDPLQVVDIFAGKYSDDERKMAKKLAREDRGPSDPRELLERARQECAKIARANVKSQVRATVKTFSVFNGLGIKPSHPSLRVKYGYVPATPAQKAALQRAGFDTKGLSKSEAGRALDTLRKRRERGLATSRQIKALMRHGWTDRNIRFETASYLIDFAVKRNWQVTKHDLQQALEKRNEQSDPGWPNRTGT